MRVDDLPSIWLDSDKRVFVAHTRRARFRGLRGLAVMDPNDALLLPRCRSVHTFGMRFALDVVFLDAAGDVVRIASTVTPRRVVSCPRARAVLETRAGAAGRFLAAGLLLDPQAIQ